MGPWIAAALPVLPGQSERVRNFAKEIEPHLEEFERLNREATVTRYANWLQSTPAGDVEIVVMEVEDPSRIRSTFTDSAYDRWWLAYLRDVHGIDMTGPNPAQAPPVVWEWRA
jgi:hypothetical protein